LIPGVRTAFRLVQAAAAAEKAEDLAACYASQPAAERVSRLVAVKVGDAGRGGGENLVRYVLGIRLAQASAATPLADERLIQLHGAPPCLVFVAPQPLQQA
jgi:hypothetical protein